MFYKIFKVTSSTTTVQDRKY